MNRRDFLKTTTGIAGAGAVSGAASPVAAQEQTTTEESSSNTTTSGEGTETAGGGTQTEQSGGGGGTATVAVGPNGDYVYTPGTEEPLYITPGTTVTFEWESDNHNVVVDSQPEGANWEGHEPLENTGFSFSSTFDTNGEYAYHCDPHLSLGMEGTIVVNDAGAPPGGGGGEAEEADPEHMGVAIQAHFVGIATILMIIASLVYSFFFLKYGESPNSSSPK